MSFVDKILRRKRPDPPTRRQLLLANGRITDGVILESQLNQNGEEIVFFLYTLNGVDFESSDILTEEQKLDPIRYAPGARVGIRYDPRNQGNSIIE